MEILLRARALALFALLFLTSLPIPAAVAAPRQGEESADPVHKFVRHYELVTIDLGAVSKQAAGEETFSIESPNRRFDVRLEPHDVRAARYRAVETLADGSERELPRAPSRTFAGEAENVPGSHARFTVGEGELTGMILTEEDTYFVEPLSRYSLAGGPTDYVLYGLSDLNPEAYTSSCATTEAQKVLAAADYVESAAKGDASSAIRVVELATEADDELVAALGSSSAANDEILSVVNQIDGVFRAEVGVSFRVAHQSTYSGGDPYSSTTSPSALLEEFRDRWNERKTGVARDLAHLWTGRDLDGTTVGIAYTGVVCRSSAYSYGLSQRMGSVPGKYVLTAHEIGHNFNACHSDTDCNANPSGCGNTIMQSSVGTGLTFCRASRDQIRAFVSSYGSCLATTGFGLAAPSGLSAGVSGARQATLTWRDNSTGETGFRVDRRARGGRWEQIATVGPNATSYTNRDLLPATSYHYRVRAVGAATTSAWSNKAVITTE